MENHNIESQIEEIMDSLDLSNLWNTPTFTNSSDLSIDDSLFNVFYLIIFL
jgi:hypothetical protein